MGVAPPNNAQRRKQRTAEVYLVGEIGPEVVKDFLRDLNNTDAANIRITLCTEGGDHHYMLACYDAIRLCADHVTIVGTGCVLSAGAFIMQAADRRLLTRETRWMMHYGSGSVDKDFLEVSKRYEDVLYGRVLEKNKDFPQKKFNKMMRDSEHLSALEALELGLVDEVI